MLIVVLCKPVVARGRNIEDTNTSLTDTAPKPLGVEHTGTCFSICEVLKLAYQF
jgi:hypothetical protein